MQTIEATCPQCKQRDHYGDELMGRYTLCTHCNCRFYIPVPELAATHGQPALSGPRIVDVSAGKTTLDDLLWDTQRGGKVILQSLRRQEKLLVALCWLLGIVAVLAGLNLVFSMVQAWRG